MSIEPELYYFLITSFIAYLLYFILSPLIIKKKPYLITKYYLFLILFLLVQFIFSFFSFYIKNILNITYVIIQIIIQNPFNFVVFLSSFVGIFAGIIKLIMKLKEKIKPLKINSILFELASDEAHLERDIKGLEWFYDDRISAEQAENYLKSIPIIIYNNTNSPIMVSGIFLEVFKPISNLNKIRYKKEGKITDIIKDSSLPIPIQPKSSSKFEVAVEDIVFIGEATKLLIREFDNKSPPNYVYPKMRFGILYNGKEFYGSIFSYRIVRRFLNIMWETSTRKRIEKITIEMIKKKAPPSQLCDKIKELYLNRGYYPSDGYFDLLYFLKDKFPQLTSYIKEVNKRLDSMFPRFKKS
jgi:hypothetical protein